MKEVIDKLDFIKMKNLYSAKDNVKRIRQPIHQEKIFAAKDIFDNGLLTKIYRKCLGFSKKTI